MAEQLKIVIDADVQKAVQGFKIFEGSINILTKQLERLQKIASLPGLDFRQQERLGALINKTSADLAKLNRSAAQSTFGKLTSSSMLLHNHY